MAPPVAVFVLCLLAFVPLAVHATVGALFTSTINGNTVNGNIYLRKEDVYLNGGPQNCGGAAGLTPGEYEHPGRPRC